MFHLQDLHTAAWNGYLGGGSAFGLYLDTMCLIYLSVVIFVFLFLDFGKTHSLLKNNRNCILLLLQSALLQENVIFF